ncbi:MAG TPA: ATP-binding protein [Stenomitos sp.]
MVEPLHASAEFRLASTWCDELPIRTPGSIQPFGALLVMERSSLTIRQASANASELLRIPLPRLLTMALPDLVPLESQAALVDAIAKLNDRAFIPLRLGLHERVMTFDGTLHPMGRWLILELEVASHELFSAFRTTTAAMLDRLTGAPTLEDLLERTVTEMRALTGYDRVMIYRFDPDMHGHVLAEARDPAMEPYLGFHFPASDIPRQARDLYQQSWIRLIRDREESPVPLVPSQPPGFEGPTDLGPCVLRSIAPIHVEYLRTMGIRSSMSISLMSGTRLWGLIACHHRNPRLIPFHDRMACEVIGARLSAEIALHEQRTAAARLVAMQALQHRLAADAQRRGGTLAALRSHLPEIAELIGAEGAAIVGSRETFTAGKTPDTPGIERLADWILGRPLHNCWVTSSLSAQWPEGAQLGDHAAGVMALRLEKGQPNLLLIFRPEIVRELTWGGDPNRAVEVKPEGNRLGPRNSLAAWKETVKGLAAYWDTADVRFARELLVTLRRQLFYERRHASAQEQDAVDVMRRKLLNIISHELRTPLTAIEAYAEFLSEGIAGESASEQRQFVSQIRIGAERLETTIDRMLEAAQLEAGTLPMCRAPVDLRDVARRALAEAAPAAAAKSIRVDELALPRTFCTVDEARIEGVLRQLLDNAIKFSPAGSRVSLHLERLDHQVRIQVSDTGIGLSPTELSHVFEKFYQADIETSRAFGGLGLGLFIAKEVVKAHGGRMGALSEPGRGSTFWFTLPC